ncbi:uncharacterized protein LOC130429670 [Triplophysa dalaica]|uniref:uncharacterized protein LOC130429670 n=1 Tax=Triplophysa dalaica TaxID=1582913 RepID=UPI0024DF60D5|nr:uncharacterized protein LOC130429670 [Triplophysa dalaica]
MKLCLIFISYLIYVVVNGVFSVDAVEVKSVSVKSGDSVTLDTDTVREKYDLIVWSYGPENTLVARINGEANRIMLSQDERFRDRVMMNDQTGDLTITHITSQHSGLYTLKIRSNIKFSDSIFNLIVSDHQTFLAKNPIIKHSQDSEFPVRRVSEIGGVITYCVICIILFIIVCRRAKGRFGIQWGLCLSRITHRPQGTPHMV